jgi:hypothetical protein
MFPDRKGKTFLLKDLGAPTGTFTRQEDRQEEAQDRRKNRHRNSCCASNRPRRRNQGLSILILSARRAGRKAACAAAFHDRLDPASNLDFLDCWSPGGTRRFSSRRRDLLDQGSRQQERHVGNGEPLRDARNVC